MSVSNYYFICQIYIRKKATMMVFKSRIVGLKVIFTVIITGSLASKNDAYPTSASESESSGPQSRLVFRRNGDGLWLRHCTIFYFSRRVDVTGGLETIPFPLMKYWQAAHLTYCVSIWDTYSVFFGDLEQMAVELFGGKKKKLGKKTLAVVKSSWWNLTNLGSWAYAKVKVLYSHEHK